MINFTKTMNLAFVCSFIRSFSFAVFFILPCFTLSMALNAAETVKVFKVSDFGAFPDDGKCDIQAVKDAVVACAKHGGNAVLKFDGGKYEFFVKDPNKDCAVKITKVNGLTIEGAVLPDGSPATVFLRKYKYAPSLDAASILFVDRCENFFLKNITFDNSPRYMTAGQIISKDEKSITVKILDGNPAIDNTIIYCANLWDPKTRNLKKVPSLTYGGTLSGDVDDRKSEYTMRRVGGKDENLFRLDCPSVAEKCAVGEIFSWHFGWLGYQVNFAYCNNLKVENVKTLSAIGIAMNSWMCENVWAKKVEFRRDGNQMQVGCRDAWILNACRGDFKIEQMYAEGVRWDGQNVCGRFAWPVEITGKNSAVLSNDAFGMKTFLFRKGDKIGFCNPNGEEVMLGVERIGSQITAKNGKAGVEIFFDAPLPDFTDGTTVCNLYGLNLDSYTLKDSAFKNIAGTASVLRANNAKIENCSFSYIMYPAVCIGGDLACAEGPISKNVSVEDCRFDNCAWELRHEAKGALSVALNPCERVPLNKMPPICNVSLKENFFKDCSVGIEARGVRGLTLSGNAFDGVVKDIILKDCLISERPNCTK